MLIEIEGKGGCRCGVGSGKRRGSKGLSRIFGIARGGGNVQRNVGADGVGSTLCAGRSGISISAEGNEEDVALELDGVGLQREGRWLFRRMTFQLCKGTFLAVVGMSGAGKTTLLNLLSGMLEATEGRIGYRCGCGQVHAPRFFRKHIGVVFQSLRLVPNSELLTNALCGRLGHFGWWQTLLGFPQRERERAWELLVDLGLGAHAFRRAAETSGGEQQRTAVARALLQEPMVLLADEPVSQLDAYHAGRVLGILRERARRTGLAVVCALHDAGQVARFADWVLSLDPGANDGWRLRKNCPVMEVSVAG